MTTNTTQDDQSTVLYKFFNLKNLVLNGIHILVVAISLWAHPIIENESVGALP